MPITTTNVTTIAVQHSMNVQTLQTMMTTYVITVAAKCSKNVLTATTRTMTVTSAVKKISQSTYGKTLTVLLPKPAHTAKQQEARHSATTQFLTKHRMLPAQKSAGKLM